LQIEAMHKWKGSRHLKQSWILVLVFSVAAYGQHRTPSSAVEWQPQALVGGSPVWFKVWAPAGTQAVSATWLGHEVRFFQAARSHAAVQQAASTPKKSIAREAPWYALAGISVETSPGNYLLKLTEVLWNGKSRELTHSIRIGRAVFPKITVKVARQYTEPSAEQLRQINADKDVKQRVFASEQPERQWTGQFMAPVEAAISDVFGTERVFNGQVQSRHLGLDYAVASGTPVHAINRGQVILARPLYFEGNCVILDHGQGLLSLYLHLSEFSVKEGEEVQTGQLLGLSGGTGRATGPHLHLAIRWQGMYLNPKSLLRLTIPPLPTGHEK
jgi:murein DD-endopeptidase MepM/ murein hydrolase activator NlpD